MGIGLSLMTVFELARVTVPTLGEAVIGRVSRDKVDARLADFARRVVDRARIRISVTGADRVPPDRAFVYMSNHQSHLDIPVIYASAPTPTLRMVAKSELFKVPVWGRAMRAASMIEVNRGDRSQAVEALRRAEALIADGVSVWIAPEGTRSHTGEIGPFKKGGFHLALATATPIVPIALRGTLAILPPRTTRMRYDVPVEVTFGAPIPVEGRTVAELMDEVRGFLAEHGGPLV
jgi:1-acyl-sn-glycerol-3-phosphate acyltransferase